MASGIQIRLFLQQITAEQETILSATALEHLSFCPLLLSAAAVLLRWISCCFCCSQLLSAAAVLVRWISCCFCCYQLLSAAAVLLRWISCCFCCSQLLLPVPQMALIADDSCYRHCLRWSANVSSASVSA